MPKPLLLLAAAAAAALTALPAAAQASTLELVGDTLTFRAASGEVNFVTISGGEGRLSISDDALNEAPAGCERIDVGYPWQCPVPGRVKVELGDGSDRGFVMHDAPAIPISYDGGEGADDLKSVRTAPVTLAGGGGNDKLESEDGGDVLEGGAGADELIGAAGDDQLRGGDGDDLLKPDVYKDGNDLVDGGAGFDRVEDWSDDPSRAQRPVSVTLDNVANDGRSGESDDVRSVEHVRSFAGIKAVMGDGDDKVEVYAATDKGDSDVQTLGGNDVLTSGNGRERLDGGAGSDRLEGGFGDDVLIGGPGRDEIHGDFTGSQCGVFQSCTIPFGNDTIDARDGEADRIDCGVGEDKATVDAIDTHVNCEQVSVGAASAGPSAQQTKQGTAAKSGFRLALARRVSLRRALSGGLRVKVFDAADRVTVIARHGTKTVGRGTGAGTVTVRFTKSAKRSLRRKRSARIVLSAAGVTHAVTLR